MAAAAWSWVEKMLHELQRTSAPSALSVSIRTAVWIVMWRQPAMRAPASTWRCAELGAERHQSRHLGLGDGDFLAPPLGEREVLHPVVGAVLHSWFLARRSGLPAAAGAACSTAAGGSQQVSPVTGCCLKNRRERRQSASRCGSPRIDSAAPPHGALLLLRRARGCAASRAARWAAPWRGRVGRTPSTSR